MDEMPLLEIETEKKQKHCKASSLYCKAFQVGSKSEQGNCVSNEISGMTILETQPQ
jgi:hypothetical protein